MKTLVPTFGIVCLTAAAALAQAPVVKPGKGSAVRVAGPSATNLAVTRLSIGAAITESAPVLAGIEILPIERSGRSPVSDLAAQDGRVVEIATGVLALQLPGPEAIRVFHYRRPAAQVFGFFAVRGDGVVEVLIERPGLGATKTVDSFDRVVGVSPDGRTIAIAASDPKSGPTGLGDAWLVRADGGTLANGATTRELTGAQFLEVDATSLTFFDGKLYAVTENGLETTPADGSAGFSTITLPTTNGQPPAEFESEFVLSADRSTMAVLAGAGELALELFRIDLGGAITRISPTPQPFVAPGFFPEVQNGPHLALSENGDFVVYQLDFLAGNELYVQPFAPGAAVHHLTPDPQFDHSIDQMSGLLTGGSFVRFLAASGQQNSDLYRSTLPALGAPLLKNLTQTSGATDPFFPNTATMLVKAQANLRLGRLLVDDQSAAGQGFTLRFSAANEVTGVVAAALPVAPTWTAAAIAPATIGLLVKSATQNAILAYDGQSAPRVLLLAPSFVGMRGLTARDGGLFYGFAADVPGTGSYVVQIGAATGALGVAPGGPYVDARDLLYSRDGRLMFAATGPGGATQTYFQRSPLAAAQPAGAPNAVAFWLR